MNYRHLYHAGNFADVVKHLLLVLCLERLREKEAPFFVLDAQGGRGIYDLKSIEAQKTREHEAGIAALMKTEPRSEALKLYLSKVREDFKEEKYPGSPLIAARMLRPQDRLLANELHPEEVKILRQMLGTRKNTKISGEDAYQCIRAHIPPPERRGLVLIDPAYEIESSEHETVMEQMQEWKKRWSTGTYLLWLPVKDSLPVKEIYAAAERLGIKRTWLCEYKDANLPPLPQSDRGDRKRMRSAALIIFNTPYLVPERAAEALAEMEPALGGKAVTRWLVPDTP